MSDKLKEFLNQKDTQEALASYNFKYIYEQLDKLSNQWEYIPEFTELMLSLGYNPLDYMTMVPPYFLYDSSIKEFTIPNHIARIDVAAFKGCINLTNITIPDSVTSIGTSAFSNCYGLISITIPESVEYIGNEVFYRCSSLTSITIPASVTNIWSSAFYGCSNLQSITFGENSKLANIWDRAFMGCNNLTSITIPDKVTSIGTSAFYGCKNLKTVYYEGTQEQWSKIEINRENEDLLNAKIIFKK